MVCVSSMIPKLSDFSALLSNFVEVDLVVLVASYIYQPSVIFSSQFSKSVLKSIRVFLTKVICAIFHVI